MNEDNEYPLEGRFAWDLVFDEMTSDEFGEMCDYVDMGDLDGAESVVARAERRVFAEA